MLSPDRKTVLGSAGSPWGQGYKDMPGKSVGVVFETEYKVKATQYQYGDEMIAIVRNAYTDKVRARVCVCVRVYVCVRERKRKSVRVYIYTHTVLCKRLIMK